MSDQIKKTAKHVTKWQKVILIALSVLFALCYVLVFFYMPAVHNVELLTDTLIHGVFCIRPKICIAHFQKNHHHFFFGLFMTFDEE